MDTVKIEFEPVVPYSVIDVHDKLMGCMEELEMEDCPRWGLIFELPMNEKSWRFCKKMRTYCEVRVFSNE